MRVRERSLVVPTYYLGFRLNCHVTRWASYEMEGWGDYMDPYKDPYVYSEIISDPLDISGFAFAAYPEQERPVTYYEYFLDDPTPKDPNSLARIFDKAFIKKYGREQFQWMQKYVWKSKRYLSKACTHIRRSRTYQSTSNPIILTHPGWYYYVPNTYHYRQIWSAVTCLIYSPQIFGDLGLECESVPMSVIAPTNTFFGSDMHHRCQKRALERMLPDLEDGFSLPVFVAELRDVPGMLKGALRLISKLPSVITELFDSPIGKLSSAQLSMSFGWIPFVSDMRKIIQRVMNLREDLIKYFAGSNTLKTYHYTIRLTSQDLEELGVQLDDGSVISHNSIGIAEQDAPLCELADYISRINYDVYRVQSMSDVMYTATMDYTYTIPNMGSATIALAALDRFGVNLSLTDVWELIPFSFVVDWFFNVQSILSRFDFSNLQPQITIHEFTESLKFGFSESRTMENVTCDCVNTLYTQWPSSGWKATLFHKAPTFWETCYYRRVGLPSKLKEVFPSLELPHGMQIILGAALIGARSNS